MQNYISSYGLCAILITVKYGRLKVMINFQKNFLFKSVQLALLTSLLIVVASCGKKQEVNLSVIEDIPTVQTFKEDAIPQADIEKIVMAGMGDSPVAIIVSAKDGSDFDAGLATQIMAVESVLLGYGTKIISSPTIVLNRDEKDSYKEQLGIPDGMSVKGVLLIGKADLSKAEPFENCNSLSSSIRITSKSSSVMQKRLMST